VTPDWLQDSSVLTYAAEHLPVVRQRGGNRVVYFPSIERWVVLSDITHDVSELSTAWERLQIMAQTHSRNKAAKAFAGKPIVDLDGFYYLRPGHTEREYSAPESIRMRHYPPELVPCNTVLIAPDEDISTIVSIFLEHGNAALIFHLRERECDTCKGKGEHMVCGEKTGWVQILLTCKTCNYTGTIPERIHVEVRESEK